MTTPHDEIGIEDKALAQLLEDEEKALAQKLAALLKRGQGMWIESEPKPRRRGRPNKSPIEKLQVLTWYYKVKSLCPRDWSDAQRDREFAGIRRNSRRKIFERVLRDGWYPRMSVERKMDSPTMGSVYLIDAVDLTNGFDGTKALIESPFWTMFGGKTLDLKAVRLGLNALLDRYRLVRLEKGLTKIVDRHVHKIADNSQGAVVGLSFAGVYAQWLRFSLTRIPNKLDRLMIVGLLLRESMLLSYIDMAVILSQIVCDEVAEFANQPWLKPLKDEFTTTVSEYIRRGHVEASDELSLYDNASFMAVSGYIVGRDSSFLSTSANQAEEDRWTEGLNATCERMSFMATTLHGPWDEQSV